MSDPIEIRPGFHAPARATDVVFDWDGTLSFFRAGWGGVMLALFLEHLPSLPGEDSEAHRQFAHDEIWRLNGRASIHQMQCLAENVAARGKSSRTAVEYLELYAQALDRVIGTRLAEVRSGRRAADAFMPPGARILLQVLFQREVRLHVVSGTEQRHVLGEAGALGVDHWFEGRIHGPHSPDDRTYGKRGMMDAILVTHSITVKQLAAFGDGQVEIDEAHKMGATAIAVASDEDSFGSGRIDAAKRARLTGVGADAVIPDYDDLPGVLALLGHAL